MLNIVNWSTLSTIEKEKIISRPKFKNDIQALVRTIIETVKQDKDKALLEFTREFDGQLLDSIAVPQETIKNAEIGKEAFNAIEQAIRTISCYHEAIKPKELEVSTAPGITLQRFYRPIDTVGLYVPGGNNTPLVSSVLMQAIPAKIAGCPKRILCTPLNKQGRIDPHLLVAAKLCGIDTIYQLGGAQAIAAMAYGTESVIRADKIFGPGNSFVTEAKTQVSIDPDGAPIDIPAGPSEVMILADRDANPQFVAADLLAQAEHGPDSQVLLICENEAMARAVQTSVNQQYLTLSRQDIIKQALTYSAIIICPSPDEQKKLVNAYAPEHLIINRRDAVDWLSDIRSAGSIFLGQWSAVTMGDYVTGSNHVIPTNGYARNHSSLGTMDFLKAVSVQSISQEGIRSLGNEAITLAMLEGLDAHANAVKQRLSILEN